MILVRPADPADALGIAQVRAAAWQAAYTGMIPAERLAELGTPEAVAREADWRAAHPMDGYLVAEEVPVPDGPMLDDPAQDDPAQDGTALDGTALDGTGLDGTGLDGTGLDGTALDGTGLGRVRSEGTGPGRAGPGSPRPGGTGAGRGCVVGFASFGPERGEDDVPGERLAGPPEQDRAELYAVYVLPGRWSCGAGRALLERTLRLVAEAGYAEISTWALEGNARGRHFYEEAGFRATGESAVLARLGGVTEVRYRRAVT